MHCVIGAARSRRLNDPLYRAIAAAVAIFGGLDHDVSFVFGGALFGCLGPGAQHDVWKSSVTDFVGMGDLYEQSRQHDQARSSHVLLSSFPQSFRNRSGSLAMFAAMRLASSFVSNFAADLRPGSLS